MNVDVEMLKLEEDFNNIIKELHVQQARMYVRYAFKPQYVILGINSVETIQRFLNEHPNSPFVHNRKTYQEFLMQFKNIAAIVDFSSYSPVPKDFVQVVHSLDNR
jgi:hypothetical protein